MGPECSGAETSTSQGREATRHDATAISYCWALCSSSDGVAVQAVSHGAGASNGGLVDSDIIKTCSGGFQW